jgi:hypothetical protein
VNSFIAGGFAAKLDEDLSEKRGLWDNIHAKRARIKAGSGERMRKPGSKGAPTNTALKVSQSEDADPCWKDYRQIGMKMKGGRSVPNCVPKEETQIEGQANWARARKENERSSVANLNQPKKSYVDRKYTPMKSDEKERVTAATKDFVSKGGTIQKIAPGKKTIKSFVRPKKYMAPNQASRVTEDINYAFEAYIGSEPASKDKNDPKNRFVGTDAIVQNYADTTPGQGKIVKEATYKGKTVSLNKPMAGDVKKSKVYVDPDGDGKAKKVNFGDKTLSIKKDQPARKRSYCARSSGQGNLSNKSSANYWSRRAWDC